MTTLSTLVFARWSFAGLGTAVDMNARLAGDRAAATASGYGTGFFDLSTLAAVAVLAVFLLILLGGTAALIRKRS